MWNYPKLVKNLLKRNHELFQAIFGIYLPKSTVFDHQNKVSDTYLDNREVLVETYVGFEWLKENGVYYFDD